MKKKELMMITGASVMAVATMWAVIELLKLIVMRWY